MLQMQHDNQRITRGINWLVILMFTALISTIATLPASSKGKRATGSNGTLKLELCRSSVDTRKYPRDQNNVNKPWGNSCCSKKEGYCVECLRGKNYCTVYPYRTTPGSHIRDNLNQPADKVLAPLNKPKRHIPGRKLKHSTSKLKRN